jgi:hypothetical protein
VVLKNVKKKYDSLEVHNNMVKFIIELFKKLKSIKIKIPILLETKIKMFTNEKCTPTKLIQLYSYNFFYNIMKKYKELFPNEEIPLSKFIKFYLKMHDPIFRPESQVKSSPVIFHENNISKKIGGIKPEENDLSIEKSFDTLQDEYINKLEELIMSNNKIRLTLFDILHKSYMDYIKSDEMLNLYYDEIYETFFGKKIKNINSLLNKLCDIFQINKKYTNSIDIKTSIINKIRNSVNVNTMLKGGNKEDDDYALFLSKIPKNNITTRLKDKMQYIGDRSGTNKAINYGYRGTKKIYKRTNEAYEYAKTKTKNLYDELISNPNLENLTQQKPQIKENTILENVLKNQIYDAYKASNYSLENFTLKYEMLQITRISSRATFKYQQKSYLEVKMKKVLLRCLYKILHDVVRSSINNIIKAVENILNIIILEMNNHANEIVTNCLIE